MQHDGMWHSRPRLCLFNIRLRRITAGGGCATVM
ncbi:MAG: hypothetical protein JWN51_1200 [Phycisphaerales bacterium]|jgi:hypothetical protein|nr:hypothetical protein [Phycisphaerales bacterium]